MSLLFGVVSNNVLSNTGSWYIISVVILTNVADQHSDLLLMFLLSLFYADTLQMVSFPSTNPEMLTNT